METGFRKNKSRLNDTTKQNAGDELIKKPEADFSAIFNNADAIIYSLDKNLHYISYNNFLEEFLNQNYNIEIRPGGKVFPFPENNDPGNEQSAIDNYSNVLNGKSLRFVQNLGTINTPLYFNFILSPIWENKEINGISCLAFDITEQKLVEEGLRKSEADMRAIFDNTRSSYILLDASLKILSYNLIAEQWTKNFSNIDLERGKSILSYYPEYEHQDFQRKAARVLKGTTVLYEISYLQPNDSINYFEVTLSPVLNDEKKVSGLCIALKDITESKLTDNALHKSEERYRIIVETAQEGIWMVDENYCTTFVNKKLCDILEYSPEEMLGKTDTYFMEEKSKLAVRGAGEKRKPVKDKADIRFVTKSGKHIWTNLSIAPIKDKNNAFTGALIMVTDITERKLDEELLRRSEAALERKNEELERKNKVLEQFAFVASHDLQEPLRTTSSFVGLIQKKYYGKLDEKGDKYLTYIVKSSERMKLLINDLLDFAQIGTKGEPGEVDCNITLREVICEFDKIITNSSAKIHAGTLPVVKGYPSEMKQLFQNLIHNSIKFRKKNVPPLISISAKEKDDYWEFAFQDNGIGIEEKHNERIFVIFQRLHTRSEYEGSGIGLSNCKKIVELHQGKIWLDSALGKGSTVHFTIPVNNS